MSLLVEKVMSEFEDFLYYNIPAMLINVNLHNYEEAAIIRDSIFNKVDEIIEFLLKNKYTTLDFDELTEVLYTRYYIDIHEWNIFLNVPIEQRVI